MSTGQKISVCSFAKLYIQENWGNFQRVSLDAIQSLCFDLEKVCIGLCTNFSATFCFATLEEAGA